MSLLDFLIPDNRGLKAIRIDRDHETRLRALEEENERLREVLGVVVRALEAQGIIREDRGAAHEARFGCSSCGEVFPGSELSRVDGQLVCTSCAAKLRVDARARDAEGVVARSAWSSGSSAKFACSRCHELRVESELSRVDGEFVCADCDAGPAGEGSYR